MLISDNLPRCARFLPTPGRPAAERFDWTPAGREPAAGEASEIRMFNHWAAGLWSGLLPEGGGVATPEMCQKNASQIWKFALWIWCVVPGNELALGGSRRCGGAFLLGG